MIVRALAPDCLALSNFAPTLRSGSFSLCTQLAEGRGGWLDCYDSNALIAYGPWFKLQTVWPFAVIMDGLGTVRIDGYFGRFGRLR